MASINTANRFKEKTHEGATAARMTTMQALRRSVMSCMLWEREFYEDGIEISARIGSLAATVDPNELAALAIEARNVANLRHVPLLLLCILAKSSKGTPLMRETVPKVIRRADELTELAALWWKLNPDTHIPHNMEKGLKAAFNNFNEYHFAKYDRNDSVKLRDVMRLVHPKASTQERNELYKRVIDRTLTTPDTWEVQLSAGGNKKEVFENLLRENALGYLALLRNLRNMAEANCDRALVIEAITKRMGAQRVLPFRYTAAARAAPTFARAIDTALQQCIIESQYMTGTTAILVDVSGSMERKLSAKSDMTRMDAAATLAAVFHGDVRIFTFSNGLAEIKPLLGLGAIEAIIGSQPHGGTYLGRAIKDVQTKYAVKHDRMIVITDEQSADPVGNPTCENAYMINVASNKNGIGYGRWTHIDGFSEAVLKFIIEHERQNTM